MPLYEYVCTECGEPTEMLQKLSEPPVTECPSCHAQALIKQISAAGFRLKGSGWYETDFKSGEKRNLVGETEGKGQADDGKAGAKPDTKADAKSEAKPDAKSNAKHGAGDGAGKAEAPAKTASEPAARPQPAAKPDPASKPAAKSPDGSKTAA